jgi:ankyrin repeat protein
VNFLLKRSIDINYREGNGHYALHFAALGRHNQIIEMLLRRKADCQCRNFLGFTPLHLGCKLGGTDSLRSLIAKGVNIHARTYDLELTPLHVACQSHHGPSVAVLLEYPVDVNARTRHGWTPIHYAASLTTGAGIVGQLLAAGAAADCATEERDTPIHLAARAGSVAVIRALMSARPALMTAACAQHNAAGDTPLILAATARSPAAVALFLQVAANPNEVNVRKQTALHVAVQQEDMQIIKLLMDAGARTDIVDIYMNTPLSKATAKGLTPIVQLLEGYRAKPMRPESKSLEQFSATHDEIATADRIKARRTPTEDAIVVKPFGHK